MILDIWKGSKNQWDDLQKRSNSSNIYQSYSWGEYNKISGWKVYRLVQRGNKKPIAISLLVKKYKFGLGVVWCPGYSILQQEYKGDILQNAIKKSLDIKLIYIRIRFLMNTERVLLDLIKSQKWKQCLSKLSTNTTLIYDFTRENNLSKNWKKNLNRFNKINNQIINWKNPDSKEIYLLYKKMEEFKKIPNQFTYSKIDSLIKSFKEDLIVIKCVNQKREIISLRAAIVYNKEALDIFSISTYEGKKMYAGYGTFSSLLELCKKMGINNYDLGGVDKKENRSVYNFKKGIGSFDKTFVGEYEWSNSIIFRLFINFCVIFYKGLR